MSYPADIDEYRDKENLAGISYHPDDKRTLFVEDIKALEDSIIKLEQVSFSPIASNSMLVNPKIANGMSYSLINGTTDIYTVPAGRRALVGGIQIRNTSGSSVTWFTKIGIGGNYYRNLVNSSTAANTTSTSTTSAFLDSGDTYAIETNNTGLSAFIPIIEFDDTSPLKMSTVITTGAGNNTLLTAPAGNGFYISSMTKNFRDEHGSVFMMNPAGSNSTYNAYLVPPAGSPGTSNLIFTQTLNAGASTGLSLAPHIPSGYSLVVSQTQTGVLMRVPYMELI